MPFSRADLLEEQQPSGLRRSELLGEEPKKVNPFAADFQEQMRGSRGVIKGATFGLVDVAKIPGINKLFGDTSKPSTMETVGELYGSAAPIGAISKGVSLLGKVKPIAQVGAKLGKLAFPAKHIAQGAVSGATYKSVGDLIEKGETSAEDVLKEAGLWAGLELGGASLFKAVELFKAKRAAKNISETQAIKEALEGATGKSPAMEELDKFRAAILGQRTAREGGVAGEGFVMFPSDSPLKTAQLKINKKGKVFVSAPRVGTYAKVGKGKTKLVGGYEFNRPEHFWPPSTEVKTAGLPATIEGQIAREVPTVSPQKAQPSGISGKLATAKTKEPIPNIGDKIIIDKTPEGDIYYGYDVRETQEISSGIDYRLYTGRQNAGTGNRDFAARINPELSGQSSKRRGKRTDSGYEIDGANETDAISYASNLNTTLSKNPHKSQVTIPTSQDVVGNKILSSSDGKSGLIVKKDGEIAHVYNGGNSLTATINLFEKAIASGGKWLSAFNTNLTKGYGRLGFKPTAKIKFDPTMAPEGWDYNFYKDFNKGKPDVVFMEYDGIERNANQISQEIKNLQYSADNPDLAAKYATGKQSLQVAKPAPSVAPEVSPQKPVVIPEKMTTETGNADEITERLADLQSQYDDLGLAATQSKTPMERSQLLRKQKDLSPLITTAFNDLEKTRSQHVTYKTDNILNGQSNAMEQTSRAEDMARTQTEKRTVSSDQTREQFTEELRKRRHGEMGAISEDWYKRPADALSDIKPGIEEAYYAFLKPDEAIKNEKFWRPVYDAQLTLDRMDAYYNMLWDKAKAAGIKEGSKASEVLFDIYNTVDNDLLLSNESLIKIVPEELLGKLTPEQQAFIRPIKIAQEELREIRGLPKFKKISQYVTWTYDDAKKEGYKDLADLLEVRPKKIAKNIFDPSAQKRLSQGKDVIQDAVRSMKHYQYYGLKKGIKEPIVKMIAPELDKMSGAEKNYAWRWINDWLGRTEHTWPNIEKVTNAVTGQVYKGALFGNIASAMTNLTQTMTTTLPELGAYYTGRGMLKFATEDGRKLFRDSGVMSELLHGHQIPKMDVFMRAEYVNRGVAYLGAYDKALAGGATKEAADRFARDIVEKTQFFSLGKTSSPEIFRRAGIAAPALQFAQYPINMGKTILRWAKEDKKKLATFIGVTVALGGPQALLPFDGVAYMLMGDKEKEFLETWRRKWSLSGLIGVNLAPRFGFGIVPSVAPIIKGTKDFYTMVVGDKDNVGLYDRVFSDELGIDFNRDIVQSKFIQNDLPLLFKGGVQAKKIADAIGLPYSRFEYRDGMAIDRKTNQPISESEITDRVKKLFVGESLEQGRIRELIGSTAKEKKFSDTARRETVSQIVTAFGESDPERKKKQISDGLAKLYDLGVTDFDRIKQLLYNEMQRQSLDRARRFSRTLSKADQYYFNNELDKIKIED